MFTIGCARRPCCRCRFAPPRGVLPAGQRRRVMITRFQWLAGVRGTGWTHCDCAAGPRPSGTSLIQVVGRVIQENGAFFLTDIEADVELGAFYRLEQAVTAANTLLGGTDLTIRSPS